MLLSLRKNRLTSLFKEVRVFKVSEKTAFPKDPFFQGRKNRDSHRRDRIWCDFLHWIFRYFLQILGGSSYQNAHKYWRKSKKSVESLQWRRRPEIADFCPLSWSNVPWDKKTRKSEKKKKEGQGSKIPSAKITVAQRMSSSEGRTHWVLQQTRWVCVFLTHKREAERNSLSSLPRTRWGSIDVKKLTQQQCGALRRTPPCRCLWSTTSKICFGWRGRRWLPAIESDRLRLPPVVIVPAP